ncbi:MAG: peptidyl-prolyl cis-trans isomerase [bacterium]|nr:peptidyl-prolyl cis-trans isomerase [bacterium]
MRSKTGRFLRAAMWPCLASACLWTAGCRDRSGDDQVAARVGKAELTVKALRSRMEKQGLPQSQETEFINNWVNEELLAQEARRRGLDGDLKWELEQIGNQLLINKLIEKEFSDKVRITDDEAAAFYEKNKSLFTVEEDEVRFLHILTRTQADAEAALQEIKAGKSFEETARERSVDSFRGKGGDTGFIRRGDMIPELSRAAFSLAEGGLSPVIRSSQGFHLIKLIGRHVKGETRSLAEVRGEIMQRLRVEKERKVYYDLLYQLKGSRKVSISPSAPEAGRN